GGRLGRARDGREVGAHAARDRKHGRTQGHFCSFVPPGLSQFERIPTAYAAGCTLFRRFAAWRYGKSTSGKKKMVTAAGRRSSLPIASTSERAGRRQRTLVPRSTTGACEKSCFAAAPGEQMVSSSRSRAASVRPRSAKELSAVPDVR